MAFRTRQWYARRRKQGVDDPLLRDDGAKDRLKQITGAPVEDFPSPTDDGIGESSQAVKATTIRTHGYQPNPPVTTTGTWAISRSRMKAKYSALKLTGSL
jgi:hypothetical protein